MNGVVSTRNGNRRDSAIWLVRIRMSPRSWTAAVLATCLLAHSATTNPSQAAPADALGSEVSVFQLAPKAKAWRLSAQRQEMKASHPDAETSPAALRKMAEAAAAAHTLPVNYFLRLIRQESGFDPSAVSPAGAQGIAQFMPGTAFERGLKDPFDPTEALPKSAELLDELRDHFGNLGLAAAAYNAGPERVRKWLAGERQLPQETIDYVRIITGHEAADWARSSDLTINLGSDASGPERRGHGDHRSWEAQLLKMLQATQGIDGASTTTSPIKLPKTLSGQGELSLCPGCIVQNAY